MKTPEQLVQDFATNADGWSFETDEDASRHDRALEKLIQARSSEVATEIARGFDVVTTMAQAMLAGYNKLIDERDEAVAEAERLRLLVTDRTADRVINAPAQVHLGADSPWPLADVLERLAFAAAHLLYDHSCDGHGHEEAGAALTAAQGYIAQLRLGRPVPAAAPPMDRTELEERRRRADAQRRLGMLDASTRLPSSGPSVAAQLKELRDRVDVAVATTEGWAGRVLELAAAHHERLKNLEPPPPHSPEPTPGRIEHAYFGNGTEPCARMIGEAGSQIMCAQPADQHPTTRQALR